MGKEKGQERCTIGIDISHFTVCTCILLIGNSPSTILELQNEYWRTCIRALNGDKINTYRHVSEPWMVPKWILNDMYQSFEWWQNEYLRTWIRALNGDKMNTYRHVPEPWMVPKWILTDMYQSLEWWQNEYLRTCIRALNGDKMNTYRHVSEPWMVTKWILTDMYQSLEWWQRICLVQGLNYLDSQIKKRAPW